MSKGKIAVLTSGGDAPGMNAAVRSVALTGIAKGYEVYGIRGAYAGILEQMRAEAEGKDAGTFMLLNESNVGDILSRGSTLLLSARCKEFMQRDVFTAGAKFLKSKGFVGLVVIGGDGSYRGAKDLCECEDPMPCIGIPATIDNDIGSTDFALGYDTAINTATHMVDCLRDTMASHSRCNIIEVMGRTVGHIALQVATAGGAICCVTAETEKDFDLQRDLIEKIKDAKRAGVNSFIVIISEGFMRPFSHYDKNEHGGKTELEWRSGVIGELANTVEAATGVETRSTIFGHVLRGGSPTVRDRVLATRFGYRAVELLDEGKSNLVIGVRDDKIVEYPIDEGLQMKQPFNRGLFDETMLISK